VYYVIVKVSSEKVKSVEERRVKNENERNAVPRQSVEERRE
jgi:hypothetical protein